MINDTSRLHDDFYKEPTEMWECKKGDDTQTECKQKSLLAKKRNYSSVSYVFFHVCILSSKSISNWMAGPANNSVESSAINA